MSSQCHHYKVPKSYTSARTSTLKLNSSYEIVIIMWWKLESGCAVSFARNFTHLIFRILRGKGFWYPGPIIFCPDPDWTKKIVHFMAPTRLCSAGTETIYHQPENPKINKFQTTTCIINRHMNTPWNEVINI